MIFLYYFTIFLNSKMNRKLPDDIIEHIWSFDSRYKMYYDRVVLNIYQMEYSFNIMDTIINTEEAGLDFHDKANFQWTKKVIKSFDKSTKIKPVLKYLRNMFKENSDGAKSCLNLFVPIRDLVSIRDYSRGKNDDDEYEDEEMNEEGDIVRKNKNWINRGWLLNLINKELNPFGFCDAVLKDWMFDHRYIHVIDPELFCNLKDRIMDYEFMNL